MRVLHIVSSVSRTGGGPSRSVQGLVAGLNAVGVETHLLAIKPLGTPWVKGVERFRCIGKMKWFGVSKAIGQAMDEIKPDIVHIHSIWQLMLHFGVVEARKRKIPYILAPRGTLEAWSLRQKWFKKQLALLTYQGGDLRNAVALHVTAESELNQCRKLGYMQKAIMSPNGVNIPEKMPRRKLTSGGARTALFLSRMHEKKGVINLVEAWGRIRPSGWKMRLVYTAKENAEKDYERRVRSRVEELGLNEVFEFVGSLDDAAKWQAYVDADLFILPSYSENFGIVVVEALYAGLPVIATKGTPWKDLVSWDCGWWVDLPESRTKWSAMDVVLKTLSAMTSSELHSMGEHGKELVSEKYCWSALAKGMKTAYEEILSNGGNK